MLGLRSLDVPEIKSTNLILSKPSNLHVPRLKSMWIFSLQGFSFPSNTPPNFVNTAHPNYQRFTTTRGASSTPRPEVNSPPGTRHRSQTQPAGAPVLRLPPRSCRLPRNPPISPRKLPRRPAHLALPPIRAAIMSYNPRMSIMPGSLPPGSGAGASSKSRAAKKEEEAAYANMRLPDREIVGCINELGISFTVQDLQKPNPIQVQMIFEWFGELLMNKTRATVDPAMRAAAEDIVGEDLCDALMPADTRNLLGFFRNLRILMEQCGVHDFNFGDLYKPTHDRLVKLLSYVINFVRFRESQTNVIDEHCNRAEQTKARIEQLYQENQNMEGQLEDMKFTRKQMEVQVAEKTKRNEELKHKLLELRKTQEKVAARWEEAKIKKAEMTKELEDKTTTKVMLKQESAKLKPYTLQSPSALQSSLAELSNTLNGDKAHIDSLDRRARALQTSTDSFAVVTGDVASCIKLLEEIGVELAKEEEENAKNAKQRDALTERGASVREVERTEALLQRQLAKWVERTETLRAHSQEKAQRAKESMEELRAVHKKLTEERSEKGKDIERRRVRIEQIEKKMLDLKENIENEVRAAYDEYLKMESHIKLYITEMEQAL
ncbi:kinetochore-associated Ndc80 complex subunit nuf2 [Podospora pseudocomata]|uniref:Probable kinetochore protein NUF2 n=1 Tax=Podospora pseudocomata TaxID=2093779 RepID=A0ABR0G911_9PEZI|nr:kinetochore-associated Ndc80 complex subunit nuf2 [Podospora pseudocomata]